MTRDTHFLMTRDTYSYPDFPKSTRGALLLSGLSQGEAHDTRKHYIRTTAISHPDNRHILSGYALSKSLIEVSRSCTSFQQPVTAHVPPTAEWKDRNEVMASHFPRSLSAAHRVMMALPPPRGIMTSQNISLPLKRETELLVLYIWTFTQGGR